jgi:cysteine dioxygenase
MIPSIQTVDQLLKNINLGPGYGGYMEILKALDIPTKEWTPYIKWDSKKYTRNCISSCDEYELLLMCWEQEQLSPIHSYSFQEGWIQVLEGELIIDTYAVNREEKSATKQNSIIIKAGEYYYLNDDMGFHCVRNSFKGRTFSLHLHIDRITEWEIFNPVLKKFETSHPTYSSISEDCDI